ncbi:MAG: hypothetical protein QM532_00185 [Cyanobium sp. MAG06]|nr:hypothetical protein [Cyanobium sp. MAG06]
MYILDIVVFNIKKELSVLSYWTNINCEVGDCIEIYIGKRLAQGVILNKQDLINNKYDIKKSSVQFRKINKVIKSGFINKDLLININNIARKNCLYTAQILETMLDNQSLELLSSININNTSDKNINYKKNNLIIYYPTIAELDRAYKDISQIFSQLKVKINIYKNHSKVKRLNKDYLINNINTIQNSVILSLPSLIPIIASDEYRPIIIASSESKYYENIKNINTKSILIDILKSLNKEVIMTDNIISVDTMYKLQNNELEIYNQNINQLMNTNLANKLRLVDRHSETIDRQGGYLPSEYIFSDKVLNLINKKISAGEPLIIMSLRKGSWTTSICRDCHTIIKCPTCKSTLVYYEMGKYFYCPYENIKYKIDENKLFRCSYCDSWRIDMLGITTQSIYNYLTNRYKDKNLNILITDTDIDKTNKQRIDKYNK